MERGAWRAAVHGVAELGTTKRLTLLHSLKKHIFILIDAGKASDKNSTPIYDKNSSESGQRGNLPQHNKGHI